MRKKLLSMALMLAMVAALVPVFSMGVAATQGAADAVAAAALARVNQLTVTSATTEADIQGAINTGLPPSVTSTDWIVPLVISPANVGVAGSITGTYQLTVTIQNATTFVMEDFLANVVVNRTIPAYADHQSLINSQRDAAVLRLQALPISNATTPAEAMAAIEDNLDSRIDIVGGSFEFEIVTEAIVGSAGRIHVVATLTMPHSMPSFPAVTAAININLTIPALPQLAGSFHWCHITETISGSDLMYAIIRGSSLEDARSRANWERIRWIPLNGELNLGRIVPRRADRSAFIAFRTVSDAMDIVSVDARWMPRFRTGEGVHIVHISGRSAEGMARGNLVWNVPEGTIFRGSESINTANYAFMIGRAGTNGWATCTASPTTIRQTTLPTGGQVEVRSIAAATRVDWVSVSTASVTTITPATTSLRVRVPAIPAAPRINPPANADAAIRGVRANAQIAILPASELTDVAYGAPLPGGRTWVSAPSANPNATAARAAVVGDANIANNGEGDVMLVRLPADARRPNSFYAVVALPAAAPPTP